jgi:hypothetical protein
LNGLLLVVGEQVRVGLERLARGENDTGRFDASLREATLRKILLAVVERVDQHLLHLLVGQPIARLDLDVLLDSCRELTRVHFQERVLVHVKAHLQPGVAGG